MPGTLKSNSKISSTAERVEFVDITTLDNDSALEVLEIRNEPAIRKNMYTDHEITRDEHFAWIGFLRGRGDIKVYAVLYDGEIVGGISLSSINTLHKRADWAFYLSETTHGRGIGAALEYKFVSLAFDQFDIEKLNCEVISFNDRVVRMHQKFGFKIEGTRRHHVVRGDERFDAVLLGVTRSEWKSLHS